MSQPQRSDAELVAAALTGDADAFGDLVRRHQRACLRIATIALGTTEGADDVVQDAFVKIFRSLHQFRPDKPLEPWMFRIVTNTARNQLRSQRRRRATATRSISQGEPLVSGDTAELVARSQEHREVVHAINRLDADDRLILTLRWFEEQSEAHIAEVLDCRPGTVKSRLSRARDRLRRQLETTTSTEAGR